MTPWTTAAVATCPPCSPPPSRPSARTLPATNAATHAEGILTLTIEDLDLKFHRARVRSKGSTIDYVL
ncbi:hypothetical protein ACIBK9_49950 [Nonomuraea sp. NPDC050227]|uniref:hypothetical protein n=1 Tax=Nonomuraea sp. NPDC050227 TaxID=3364360 RepID=UPI0037A001C4